MTITNIRHMHLIKVEFYNNAFDELTSSVNVVDEDAKRRVTLNLNAAAV